MQELHMSSRTLHYTTIKHGHHQPLLHGYHVDFELMGNSLRVAVRSLLPAKRDHRVGKPSVVLHPPLGTTSLTLLLLLSLHLHREGT